MSILTSDLNLGGVVRVLRLLRQRLNDAQRLSAADTLWDAERVIAVLRSEAGEPYEQPR